VTGDVRQYKGVQEDSRCRRRTLYNSVKLFSMKSSHGIYSLVRGIAEVATSPASCKAVAFQTHMHARKGGVGVAAG
jgi:hypothetical protein